MFFNKYTNDVGNQSKHIAPLQQLRMFFDCSAVYFLKAIGARCDMLSRI